jgi:ribonuclease Z
MSSATGAARQSFYFQFVTTPTADTPGTTLLLHFNSQRYIFGQVSEGTQRAFIERGVGLRKIQNIFLTGKPSWSHQGGLLGMLLTTADVHASAQLSSECPLERPRLNIHGPLGTAHMLASARRFIFRTGMPLSVHEYGKNECEEKKSGSQPTWSDENVQVWALPGAISSSTGDDSSDSGDSDTVSRKRPTFGDATLAEIEQQQAARHSIIQDMFDSNWRHDRLLESEFKDVRLPAKIFIRDPTTKTLNSFNCASMSDAPLNVSPDTKVLVRQPWPGSRWESLPDRSSLPHEAVSYIVRGHAQRGVFEKERAKALGLKPGPMYGLLAAGRTIETDDGKVITPDMVLGPSKPGRGIAIIDLPDGQSVNDLLSRPEWSNPEVMTGVDIFCWLVSDGNLARPEVQDFIRSMPRVQHIVASPERCPNYLAMESSAASTIRLSLISRDHFPIPVHDNAKQMESEARSMIESLPGVPGGSCRAAERGITIQIEPKYQVQEQEVVLPLNTYKVVQEVPQNVLSLARDALDNTKDALRPATELEIYDNSESGNNEPEIITLGTGSAVPSKYRNVSATLLKMPGYGYYLFDCGENTLGQLKRMYRPEILEDVLSNMRMIWISHLHADHHLGMLSLLRAVRQTSQRLKPANRQFALIADEAMIDFVRDMVGKKRSSLNASSIMHHIVCRAGQPLRRKSRRGDLVALEDDYLETTLHIRRLLTTWVSHCAGAQAVSIEFMNGFKISYSGDCRPSKNFARIGADSDVLIHEATFEDGLEGDATAKKHSTTSEALGVAAQMRAKNVILTHFSQRYQKIPVMNHIKRADEIHFEEGAEESGPPEPVEGDTAPSDLPLHQNGEPPRARSASPMRPVSPEVLGQMNVCIAFDFMRTRVSQIKGMHRFYPAIEALFEAELKVESAAATKRKAEEVKTAQFKEQSKESKKKLEKRKSDSDGENGQLSMRARRRLKRDQDQDQTRDEGNEPRTAAVASPVVVRKVSTESGVDPDPVVLRKAEASIQGPVVARKIATGPDALIISGTRHVDLRPDVDDLGSIGRFVDSSRQAERNA